MNKKFQKIILLFLLIITLTGCTKRFTIEDKEDNTKKAYVSNIICKPESEDLLKIYTDNAKEQKIDIDNLPNCSELKINSGGYEGLWTSIFVKPLAWLIIKLGNLVKNYGISIMIIGFLLRALMFPISKKTNNMSKNMKKAQKELENLENLDKSEVVTSTPETAVPDLIPPTKKAWQDSLEGNNSKPQYDNLDIFRGSGSSYSYDDSNSSSDTDTWSSDDYSDSPEPFYGIWCEAYKTKSDAKKD